MAIALIYQFRDTELNRVLERHRDSHAVFDCLVHGVADSQHLHEFHALRHIHWNTVVREKFYEDSVAQRRLVHRVVISLEYVLSDRDDIAHGHLYADGDPWASHDRTRHRLGHRFADC